MRYFNRAAVCVALLLCSLCGLASAETLYREDSTKVEFTMGCWYNNGISQAKDAINSPEILFDPLFITPGIETTGVIENALDYGQLDSFSIGYSHFISYKTEFISEYFKDKIGDTISIICPKGTFLGTIKDIGFEEDFESTGPRCRLWPIDINLIHDFIGYNQIIALRNYPKYIGPIFHFEPYNIHDSSEIILAEALKDTVAFYWAEYVSVKDRSYDKEAIRKLYNDSKRNNISCFKRIEEPLSDTMFWAVYFEGYDGAPTYMVYLVVKYQEKLIFKPLFPYGQYGDNIEIVMAMDLDGNGKLEYLIRSSNVTTTNDELYKLEDGEFRLLAHGCSGMN
jgi:hypothetical protein